MARLVSDTVIELLWSDMFLWSSRYEYSTATSIYTLLTESVGHLLSAAREDGPIQWTPTEVIPTSHTTTRSIAPTAALAQPRTTTPTIVVVLAIKGR